MDSKRRTHLSKFLSRILRHDPGSVGLALDEGGWCEIDRLASAMTDARSPVTPDEIHHVAASCPKRRFAVSDDGLRIRANQGHSLAEVELGYEPRTPPDMLYHGTAVRSLEAIRREGLRPMSRRHLHLFETPDTPQEVARRHGPPALLVVEASRMHATGHSFYHAPNGVWLADAVPPEFLRFPERDLAP